MRRKPRTPHKYRRLLIYNYYESFGKIKSLANQNQKASMEQERPWRSKRLQKQADNRAARQPKEHTLPQVSLKSLEDSKDQPKQKRKTRAMQEREAVRQINEYRQKILERVNKECIDYRVELAKEQEERRNTTISFNAKKEVLEFCKKFHIQPRSKVSLKEPPMKHYEIKSAFKGSIEVYTGEVPSKRSSILGNYHINEETVVELQSEECSMQKPPEETTDITSKKSPRSSPKPSPKSSPKKSNDKKKDRQSKCDK